MDRPSICKRSAAGTRREFCGVDHAYDLGVSHIIAVDGREAGYLQVVEFKRQIYLRQLHLADFARNHGIGAHLIEQLKARGVELGKPVTLDVLHCNRACELYLRRASSRSAPISTRRG